MIVRASLTWMDAYEPIGNNGNIPKKENKVSYQIRKFRRCVMYNSSLRAQTNIHTLAGSLSGDQPRDDLSRMGTGYCGGGGYM